MKQVIQLSKTYDNQKNNFCFWRKWTLNILHKKIWNLSNDPQNLSNLDTPCIYLVHSYIYMDVVMIEKCNISSVISISIRNNIVMELSEIVFLRTTISTISSLNKTQREIPWIREGKKRRGSGNAVENPSKTRRIQRHWLSRAGNRLVVNGNEQSFPSRGNYIPACVSPDSTKIDGSRRRLVVRRYNPVLFTAR